MKGEKEHIDKLKKAEETFHRIVEDAKQDEGIIGLYLSGSRGKNQPTIYSDYDVVMIVKDGLKQTYEEKYAWVKPIPLIDVYVQTLSEFK